MVLSTYYPTFGLVGRIPLNPNNQNESVIDIYISLKYFYLIFEMLEIEPFELNVTSEIETVVEGFHPPIVGICWVVLNV